ncbi:MAG: hypothetical protein ACO3U0_01125 [Ilumatobacteraceae bacterium]
MNHSSEHRHLDSEQLTLLTEQERPARERFRIDDDTRQRGLAHIAVLRAQLAQRRSAHSMVPPTEHTADRAA